MEGQEYLEFCYDDSIEYMVNEDKLVNVYNWYTSLKLMCKKPGVIA